MYLFIYIYNSYNSYVYITVMSIYITVFVRNAQNIYVSVAK